MIQEVINSGILELYCLGQVSNEEKLHIEEIAAAHVEIKEEILAIKKTLEALGKLQKNPQELLERKIFDAIASKIAIQLNLPPILSKSTSRNDWFEYFSKNNITKPEGNELLYFLPLPSNKNLTTYIVFAKLGGHVEESHDTELERLFMLKGSCSIRMHGIKKHYHENDFVDIPPNTLHEAVATSDDMILIGQRLSA